MAHVKVNEAQQHGAFNNGAVGQQSQALCPYPYVWDRVRKACVLPDELAWEYAHIDRIPVYQSMRRTSLGAGCPEGSSTKYTGVKVPGTDCYCAPGRVVHNGYCQSPQSVVQQSSSSIQDFASMSVEQQLAQPLNEFAKNYIRQTGHTVSCKLVTGSPVPGMPNYPTMMCSIDGGPYEHGAYAINLNPETAVVSAMRNVATQQVAQATGIAPGAVAGDHAASAAVDSAVLAAQEQQAQAVQEALAPQTPIPPMSVDTGTQAAGITTLPPPPSGSQPTGDGGYTLPDGSYAAPGTYADDGGLLGSIPWWVWVAGGVGVYMAVKK